MRFLLTLAFLFLSFPVMAQSLDLSPDGALLSSPAENVPKTQEAPFSAADIPDAVFYEVKTFERYCQLQPTYYQYYDCECLAARFLDQRILVGPDAERTSIMMEIEDHCQDATQAAGQQYQTCLGNTLLLPSNNDPELYCQCYANKFAEIFEDNNLKVKPSVLISVQTEAHSQCQQPGAIEDMLLKN